MQYFFQKNKKYTERGYSLVEVLFYVSLFAILILAVINSLVTMTKAFREVSIQTDLTNSHFILERISRETRRAFGINTISANNLKLNTKDDIGNNETVHFVFTGFNLQFFKNDVFIGNLNNTNIEVTAVSFIEITTTVGKAIKISISVRSTKDVFSRVENFYDTVVLRGDYGS